MKTILTVLFITISTNYCAAQRKYLDVCVTCDWLWHTFDFNSVQDSSDYYFEFDSSQVNNIWQVGLPSKPIFNFGYQQPRALLTDSVNAYPINNISSFQFSLINCGSQWGVGCGGSYWGPYFDLVHRIESDQGADGGTIEVSHDNGVSWTNLISDSINAPSVMIGNIYSINDTVSSLGKPGFSGSVGWDVIQFFYQSSYPATYDTITIRFTFASDSIQTNRDGWMIGLIGVQGVFEGIKEIISSDLLSAFPNPATNSLVLLPNEKLHMNGELLIIDAFGRVVFSEQHISSNSLDISSLSEGLYFLKYSEENKTSGLKFIKR